MHVKSAYLENTFRNQDDMDGCPLIIGVGMVKVSGGHKYIACFHLRYADGETKYMPISTLRRVTILENKEA